MPSTVPQINVLVSSTRDDLMQYREEASRIIEKLAGEASATVQLRDRSMEKESQSGDREFAVEVSKKWVEASQWVIVVVGWYYGTISDEPDSGGLSVTEWEYRHAFGLDGRGRGAGGEHEKKIFVFAAGEPGTANQFRALPEEEKDLKDWRKERQTPDQIEKQARFRQLLLERHAALFSNLQNFREQLEQTLRAALADVRPEIEPGTPLAGVIVSLMPAIRRCLADVTCIASCKRVHDRLHDVRKHVIGLLRDEVLPLWAQESALTPRRERQIWGSMSRLHAEREAIRVLREAIGPEHAALRLGVDALLAHPLPWNLDANSSAPDPTHDRFAEDVSELARVVQDAFSEANRSMMRDEGDLREHFLQLIDALSRAKEKKVLADDDQRWLDQEMKRVGENREHVKDALARHSGWQEAHDKLVELDGYRDLARFPQELNHYRNAPVRKLLDLAREDIEELDGAPPGAPGGPPRDPADRELLGALRAVRTALERFAAAPDPATFDELRGPFDQAFYLVDKRTLAEVERARERARTLQEWLDHVAQQQGSDPRSSARTP